MERRRHRFGSLRGWAAGLGIVAATLLGGTLIARETVAGMDPFYRDAVPWEWRERRLDPGLRPTEAPTAIYSPIEWHEAAMPLVPPRPDPAFDDPALLGSERERAFAPVLDIGEPMEDEPVADVAGAPLAGEREREPPPEFEPSPDQEEGQEGWAPTPAIVPE